METAFVLIVACGAAFYLYRKFRRNDTCGCGRKDCPSKQKHHTE